MPESAWASLNSRQLINVSALSTSVSGVTDILTVTKEAFEAGKDIALATQEIVDAVSGLPALSPDSIIEEAVAALDSLSASYSLSGTVYALLIPANSRSLASISSIVEATFNSTDINRPQFTDTQHVAGSVITFGAADYRSAMMLMERIKRLSSNPNSAVKELAVSIEGERSYGYRVPTNLRAYAVNRPSGVAIHLSWDPEHPVMTSPLELDTYQDTLSINKVLILRSQEPIQGPAYTSSVHEDLVISEIEFAGISALQNYEDTSAEEGSTYYYAVAYEYLDGATVVIPHRISNVYEVSVEVDKNRTAHSIEPYWVGAQGFIGAVMPQLDDIMSYISSTLSNYSSVSTTTQSNVSDVIGATYDAEIQRLEDIIRQLSRYESLLTELALPFSGEVGVFSFYTDEGNLGILNALNIKLSDTGDENLPTSADRILGAFIVLAGSSSAEVAETNFEFLSAMFGNTGEPDPALLSAIESLQSASNSLDTALMELDDSLTEYITAPATADPPTVLELP